MLVIDESSSSMLPRDLSSNARVTSKTSLHPVQLSPVSIISTKAYILLLNMSFLFLFLFVLQLRRAEAYKLSTRPTSSPSRSSPNLKRYLKRKPRSESRMNSCTLNLPSSHWRPPNCVAMLMRLKVQGLKWISSSLLAFLT